MFNAVRVSYENLRSIAFGSLSTNYTIVGTAFAHPVRLLKVTNTTDADVLISFDGISDKDILPGTSAYVYDYESNKTSLGGAFEQPTGQAVYAKYTGSAPSKGSVYVTVIYGSIA